MQNIETIQGGFVATMPSGQKVQVKFSDGFKHASPLMVGDSFLYWEQLGIMGKNKNSAVFAVVEALTPPNRKMGFMYGYHPIGVVEIVAIMGIKNYKNGLLCAPEYDTKNIGNVEISYI